MKTAPFFCVCPVFRQMYTVSCYATQFFTKNCPTCFARFIFRDLLVEITSATHPVLKVA
jgi:hypothetical protein